ncbi:hypothetical protein HYALB_00010058 [Hymenoscyphus albidus]|uniref:Reverse transcriptase domain-containing protein n=1 Tax=Hymenoscyphus albidus TaxID=595503 RepID=A0A9N9LIL4_9HELO|nr:hypothetical protein HYALB_00010058 [Hymenoscyphus albidus]
MSNLNSLSTSILTHQQGFFVTKLASHSVIIGYPWMYKHDPVVRYQEGLLSFNTEHCRKHCLPSGCYQLPVRCTDLPKPKSAKQQFDIAANTASLPRRVGPIQFMSISKRIGTEVFALSCHEIDVRLRELGVSEEELEPVQKHDRQPRYSSKSRDGLSQMKKELAMEQSPIHLIEHSQASLSPASLELQQRQRQAADMHIAGASLEEIRKALAPKTIIDPASKLPPQYHEHLGTFDKKRADKLPPHRDCDHSIELLPGTTPPYGPLYNMSQEELLVLREYLREQLDKGFIRASTSPAAAPVLFAKKPGGGLRFCVDYRGLNAITIKNRYPLPLVQETLQRISRAKYFTKLDVIHAFNRIRIKEGDEWITAFNTRYGLFEQMVMPFGLTNAPATFQARMNEVLRPWLDVFCTAYIDDVLIYSDDLLSHRAHVHQVLKALGEAGLHLDIKKCEFEVQEVKYLGMVISTEGVMMDPEKISAITE